MANRLRLVLPFLILGLSASWLVAQEAPLSNSQSKEKPSQVTASTVVGQFESVQQEEVTATSEVSTDASTAFLFDGSAPTSVDQLRIMEARFQELAQQLYPATVNIRVGASQGSGVIVSSDGYVLTAAHVISRPGIKATVYFPDGTYMDADTLGVNIGPIDSGMLKIRNKGKSFKYINLGVSKELKKGQWVMAVGHPGGYDEARGLVTRVGRIVNIAQQAILTDCTLVGGDSGGPLIDMNGRLIGIHSRIGSSLSDNRHVPVDEYSENWDKLAKGLLLHKRPYIGISMVDETNEVREVTKNQAAAKAGVKVGDFLVGIEQLEIKDRSDINQAIKELGLLPRQKIKIKVLRDGEEKELKLTVGAPPTR